MNKRAKNEITKCSEVHGNETQRKTKNKKKRNKFQFVISNVSRTSFKPYHVLLYNFDRHTNRIT